MEFDSDLRVRGTVNLNNTEKGALCLERPIRVVLLPGVMDKDFLQAGDAGLNFQHNLICLPLAVFSFTDVQRFDKKTPEVCKRLLREFPWIAISAQKPLKTLQAHESPFWCRTCRTLRLVPANL